MTAPASHGATTRQPVYSGNRRVQGLYERKLANGSTVYDVNLRLGGKPRRHTLAARTKTDAIAELRALWVDYERGESHRSRAASVTVDELMTDYLAHLNSRIGHRDSHWRFSRRTVEGYEQRYKQHIAPALGTRSAPDVDLAELRRLIDRLGAKRLAPSTITGIISIISGLFRFGVKRGVLARNVVRDLDRDDRPGVGRLTEPRYLTIEQVLMLLKKMGDTFRPVAMVCVFSALRISEALGLRWRDVDFKASTLTVSGQLGAYGEIIPAKTPKSEATVPLLPALARELHAHRSRQAGKDLRRVHPDALVFTTSRGKPQSRRNALRALYKAGDACGLNGDGREPVGLHDLRHTFIGIATRAASLPEASKLGRHANPRVTSQMYAGLAEGGLEGAATKLTDAGFGC